MSIALTLTPVLEQLQKMIILLNDQRSSFAHTDSTVMGRLDVSTVYNTEDAVQSAIMTCFAGIEATTTTMDHSPSQREPAIHEHVEQIKASSKRISSTRATYMNTSHGGKTSPTALKCFRVY